MSVEQESCDNTPPPRRHCPKMKPTILNRVVREDLIELLMLEQRFEGGECMNNIESEGRMSQLEGLTSAKA